MDLRQRSIQIIKENQATNGAYMACPNFNNYRFCWLRDGSFIANAMDRVGEYESADRFFQWVDQTIRRYRYKVEILLSKEKTGLTIDGADFLATRYTMEGFESADGWGNFQLDGYGTWLWALTEHCKYSGKEELLRQYHESIELTALYLCHFWKEPNFDCWEEYCDQIHTSTLACIYGGLNSINQYLASPEVEKQLKAIRRFVEERCIINEKLTKFAGIPNIDASLLWAYLPFRLFDGQDQFFKNTMQEIEKKLYHRGGVHRYPEDTYYGGGEWLLLSCWLGWCYYETGQLEQAHSILNWVEQQVDQDGNMPEQTLQHVNDPGFIQSWIERWGPVAKPLLWSHAMYLILHTEIQKPRNDELKS